MPEQFIRQGNLFMANPNYEAERAAEKEHEDRLQALYREDAEVRAAADDLHRHRMLPGPACEQCIEAVAKRLGKLSETL